MNGDAGNPRANRRRRAGQSLVEFSFVGIPLIFLLISITDMAWGMWNYQTLAYSVRAGARYAAAHGQGCTTNGNTCSVTVANVAHAIATAAVGVPPGNFGVVLASATAAAVSCTPLNSCYSNNATWPPAGDNAPGKNITISGTWVFRSALSMFWPGAGTASFGTFTLGAWTKQAMQF